ncbi:MAG: DUF433 domain-containing protein [Deltaproteobacteria bacterium]|nr:MAG: DUF433 domain-containing protein [Deltaproteobacteria bacterium]
MDRDLLRRISADPAVCFGKPCIRGTRIWVSLLLDLMAGGMTEADILEDYPGLTKHPSAGPYGTLYRDDGERNHRTAHRSPPAAAPGTRSPRPASSPPTPARRASRRCA